MPEETPETPETPEPEAPDTGEVDDDAHLREAEQGPEPQEGGESAEASVVTHEDLAKVTEAMNRRAEAFENLLAGDDESLYPEDEYDYEQPEAEGDEDLDPRLRELYERDQQRERELQDLVQSQRDKERLEGYAALEGEFKELAEPEVAQEVVARARDFARSQGNPELALDPSALRMVYLAMVAERKASEEREPSSEGGVPIESGAGQNAGRRQRESDDFDLVLQKAGRASGGDKTDAWGYPVD